MASILIIAATLNVGGAILAETGLSYLGFGVAAPDVSLGTLIAEGTGLGFNGDNSLVEYNNSSVQK